MYTMLYRSLSAQSSTISAVSPVNIETIGLRKERVFDHIPTGMEPAAYAVLASINDVTTCKQLSKFFDGDYENTLFAPWPSFQQEFNDFYTQNSYCFSHMAQYKIHGAAHRDTLLRKRGSAIIAKKPLTQLKLNDKNEITDYFQPERDRLLYTALRKRLIEYGGDSSAAFAQPFYKPKTDGTPGPLVKSAPIIQHPRTFVDVRGGVGTHGDMIRIDVFRTPNKEYYYVPIYVKDTLQPTLPLRAVTKNPDRMLIMSETDFLCSLYSNDIIYIEFPETVQLKSVSSADTIDVDQGYFLRGKVQIKSGTFEITTLDKQYTRTSIPFYSLYALYKCEVDPLGKIRRITTPEKRMHFHLK